MRKNENNILVDLFENEHYRQYKVDGILNEILLAYQQYFRETCFIAIVMKKLPQTN